MSVIKKWARSFSEDFRRCRSLQGNHGTGTGVKAMTEHILEAYRIDIEVRTNPEGNQRAIADGWKVNAHEIKGCDV
jgi:hypothetical protein